WRPAGASALFQRRLQVIGSRCGLEDEGHDAGGDHGRTGRTGSWRARETTPPQKARSSRRADMQTCTIRRLRGGLNGAEASSGSGSLQWVHRAEEDDMQPMTELEADRLRRYYRTFARVEAADTSPVYAEWAQGVADDDAIIDLLLDLPQSKRQANLLFAAARHLGSGTGTFAQRRAWLLEHGDSTRALMLERSTQTNEAGRCAVLLPELARLDGPLSLIEVGASAGLCLYPDRYSYRYRTAETG